MINVLIADDNIDYAVNLMNYINEKNSNIKVCNIAKNGQETLELLNLKNDIDVILLDYKMPFLNGNQVLDKIIDKEKYSDSFIIISGEIESAIRLRDNEMIHSIINKNMKTEEIIKKINELFEYKESVKQSKILKNKITDEILFLGYDISHKGTQYLIKAIDYIATNPDKELEKLEKNVYPKIASIYNDSVHNVKCRINNSTTIMYYNCEVEKLKKYFCFSTDVKPKVKTVINTIINKIQQ